MDISDSAGAAPLETSAEHTEEVQARPEAALAEAPAPGPGEAQAPAFQDAVPAQPDIRDLGARKPAGQGRKLVVVGIVAAGLAFVGVYLLQTKPWQPRVALVSSPTPAIPEPAPAVPPAAPQVRAPLPPAAPAPPPHPRAEPVKPAPSAAQAEPVKPAPSAARAEPVKPAEKVPTPKPTEAAKPEENPAQGKHPGQAAGSSKKTAGKPAPTPGSGQVETVYMLKVRSLPVGAQVLIDDEPMGPTPFQRRILDADKSHKVTIRRLGYEPYEHIVTPTDAWAEDGNTQTMKLVAKLKRTRVQADAPSAVPEAQPAPVPEQSKQP
jgi:hypothetical protein